MPHDRRKPAPVQLPMHMIVWLTERDRYTRREISDAMGLSLTTTARILKTA